MESIDYDGTIYHNKIRMKDRKSIIEFVKNNKTTDIAQWKWNKRERESTQNSNILVIGFAFPAFFTSKSTGKQKRKQ